MPNSDFVTRNGETGEPTTIKLPYKGLEQGFTPSEWEVQIVLEDRVITFMAPLDGVDDKNKFVYVFEVGRYGESVFIELPGEPLNTGRRLEVSRKWLESAVYK